MADGIRKNPGLLTAQGRGVRNGVPYGEQLHNEGEARLQQMWFAPAARRRLEAVTRKALGR